MTVKPILTEKSLELAKGGWYSFWVPKSFTKFTVKRTISEIFDVTVTGVKTSVFKSYTRKNLQGRKKTTPARKKALVKLGKDQKIGLFGEGEKQ